MDSLAASDGVLRPAAPTAPPLLKVAELRRSFGAVRAVDGLDLEVEAGSITGMIGPNGCGKTTAVNCITGFDRGCSGSVELQGRSIARRQPEEIARGGVMRTFQAIRVFDGFSVLENAAMGRQCFDGLRLQHPILRTPRFRQVERETRARAEALLETVGLGAKKGELAGSLSYGQKKLLALAGILMSEPKIVILDEPVAGVNPTMVHEIAELLRRLNAAGTTFLIIEHNIEFVMALSDRVVVMDRGRRLASGTPAEIQQDERVLEAYLGGGDGGL
ncbi:branched-chain amino acid transport system ATP-binding protein [Tistlia consotensis]|uniref:Branched-chain amino acid transport system ATP-binding protein n=1 Tax=Tistlia consotensis USBA 355 TaxID=560819 RepID=A0A1Y6C729_9PROT|nr:ABC transporter ATP-binding protein [Tistlia consotensis]SMF47497.1 branched-chain amino acid transport system ATP-binding protein [Tistlia consotensis USBA 355]SNR82407.1 branched-chain amino acid transport system ATP-binding protein [Tistlia consotensis]